MRYKSIFLAIIFGAAASIAAAAQQVADTIFNPPIVYGALPRVYEIAGITVSGAPNYDDSTVLGYAGLKTGDRMAIPGDDLTDAVKRLMRHGLFSQVQVKVLKTAGDKAWIELALRTQPRISKVNYLGMKKSDRDDIQEKLQLMKGNQITQNIVNRAEAIIRQHYKQKGYGNADVKITLHEDLSAPNEMIVDIAVNRHDKVKVHKIYLDGNEVLSDSKLKRTIKKTNEKNNILKLFSQKKFVESDYEDDLNRILEKYNELGYRDARIVADSVVPYDEKTVDVHIKLDEGHRYYIKDISWVGNTVYPPDMLAAYLDMKPGDVYNQKHMNKRLTEDDDAVSNLYMDNGYLFFDLVPIEREVKGDSISLEMRVTEGPQARINNVIINGNDRLYEKVIRRELRVKPGQLFSKADLMRSAREIAQTGHFNPENMDIRPEPNQENGTVDILFDLESKANDQIEFSLGWGQTGIIGKLSLKFTNFSIKNLFYPSTYRGIIPQGEGQTFTISAQTNARYYQAYSVSFLDPWFGGKRPNSLSVSAYYSRQTGVNSSYYNSTWANSAYNYGYYGGYGYGGYGYGNNYYNDYYQNSYQNSYDPNKVLQMVGVNVGFGKRLKWPDDYFTFTAELGYNWYYLKNWDYLYYMNNGTSNALVLGLTLARNSIDNPLYTREGSTFSLNFQITPPASLFGKRDWKKLSEENTVESKKQLYRWIEYWKLRFKSRTYTPLCNANGTYTPRADDTRRLRSARQLQQIPQIALRDILRGRRRHERLLHLRHRDYSPPRLRQRPAHPVGTRRLRLQPPRPRGPLPPYAPDLHHHLRPRLRRRRQCLDLGEEVQPLRHEALRRRRRTHLPAMVGMMGIDWAYGFDRINGEKGGSHFHFILGQEF